MRILLDARYRTRSGASNYISAMVPRLVRAQTDHEFVILTYVDQDDDIRKRAQVIEMPPLSAWRHAIWDQVALPRLLRKQRIDVVHAMKTLGPLVTPCPVILVGHSITVPFRGEFPATWRQKVYWNSLGSALYRRSTAIIAVSGFVRDFLVEALGVPSARVHLIYSGIDPRFGARPPHGSAAAEPNDAAPYVLCVGNLFPVKNQATAIAAFAKIATKFPELRLKLAGGTDHPYAADLITLARELGVTERVEFLGFVDSAGIGPLMRQATLLLQPSLTEGFPITLLEAMASGVPILAAERGGMPELGSDAIAFIEDPMHVGAWAERLDELIRDARRRARMREAGLQRVRAFDWDVAAQRTLRLYEAVGAGRTSAG